MHAWMHVRTHGLTRPHQRFIEVISPTDAHHRHIWLIAKQCTTNHIIFRLFFRIMIVRTCPLYTYGSSLITDRKHYTPEGHSSLQRSIFCLCDKYIIYMHSMYVRVGLDLYWGWNRLLLLLAHATNWANWVLLPVSRNYYRQYRKYRTVTEYNIVWFIVESIWFKLIPRSLN